MNSSTNSLLLISDSAFKQQRLKAWQPILTAQVATIFFLIIFVLFIVLGAVLLVASDSVSKL